MSTENRTATAVLDRDDDETATTADRVDAVSPPGRGWASKEEQRIALGGLAGFLLLGLYAALFVTIAVLWS